jgi:hypothetical protein
MLKRWLLGVCAIYLPGCGSSAAPHAPPANDGGLLLVTGGLDASSSSCDASDASLAGAASASCTPSKPRDFAKDVQPLFASCSGEICHSFTAHQLAAEVGLAAAECCPKRLFIAPGAPQRSYLLDKLRGEALCAGARMPLDQPPLSEPEIQAISDWICEGAQTGP